MELDISKKTTAYEKPGWYEIDGKFVYITPQGAVGYPAVTSYSKHGQTFVSLNPDRRYFYRYLDMINITRSPVGAILVLYTTMNLCNTFFRKANFTPKFLLFVNGYRGSFKTSLALAMTQIESRDTPPYTLKATKAGTESAFKIYRDAVILVDDLAPTQNLQDRRNMQSNMETVVRAFGDGTGHKRATVQYESEGGAIITGEYTTGCESSLARCLFLNLDKNDVDRNRLSAIQNDKGFVLNFALSFISTLSDMINYKGFDIVNFISTRGKEIRKMHSGKYSNERYGEYIAQLMVTAELLLHVGKVGNWINDAQVNECLGIFANAIQMVVENNNVRLKQQSPISVLCTALHSCITEEKYPLCKLGGLATDLDKVILYDTEYYYMTQTACRNMVNTYIKENDISCPEYTLTSVATTLASYSIISEFKEGNSSRKSTKLSGYGSKRFMKINKAEFQKHISNNATI